MQHGKPDQISEKCGVLMAQIPPEDVTRFVFSVGVIPNWGESTVLYSMQAVVDDPKCGLMPFRPP